jgi:hypothetical protein
MKPVDLEKLGRFAADLSPISEKAAGLIRRAIAEIRHHRDRAEEPPRTPDEMAVLEAARRLSRQAAGKGGKARAAALSPERRREIARRAVEARWAKARGATKED